jgi:hypothetical protein
MQKDDIQPLIAHWQIASFPAGDRKKGRKCCNELRQSIHDGTHGKHLVQGIKPHFAGIHLLLPSMSVLDRDLPAFRF